MKLNVKDGLYEVLGVTKDATQVEIKKAYMKMALKLHPDKNPDDEEAKERFQTLQRVYAVLRDPERRKVYDQTGRLEDSEELSGEKFDNLYSYYRSVFKKVEEEDVIAFENEYRGSDEEADDLLRLYKKHKGDMPVLFEWMLCSRPDMDSHRFADAIERAIEDGKAKRFKRFDRWAEVVRAKPAPKDPLKKSMPAKQRGGGMDLVAMIRGKAEKQHSSFISDLEAKYGNGSEGSKGRKKKTSKEPSDKQFLAAQSKLLKKTGKKTKRKA